MLSLLFTGIIAIIIIAALIIIINNRPDIWFWLFLNLYFDPGGYIGGYSDGNLMGPLTMADIFIVGIVICLISAKFNWKIVSGDIFFQNFLFFLLLYSIYYFVVYGGIVPYFHNDFDYTRFLIKNRMFIYGLIILISVYVFSLRSLKYFYNITIFIGVICLSLYLITLLTGLDLIPVWELKREGTEMTRITLLSYGLFNLIFPLALIVFLLNRFVSINLECKVLLYYGGILMLITLLITLTRRIQIDIIGTAIIILILVSYLFRTGTLKGLFKLLIPVITVSIILFLTMPDYAGYIKRTAEDTFLVLTTGENISGETEYRATGTGDLEITKVYISDNLFFGTGYTFWNYGEGYASSTRGAHYARAADAASEVPIYYLLFGFGIAGALFIFPLYFLMGKLFVNLITSLKSALHNYLHDPITIIFTIYMLLTITIKFTINLYQLSSDFLGPFMSNTAVLMGIGFALNRKIYLNSLINNITNVRL